MKKLSLFLLLISSGCQTGEPVHPIVGDWRWVSSSGGIATLHLKPRNNDEHILRLTTEGTFEGYTNKLLFYSGKYHLTKTTSIYDHEQKPSFVIDHFVYHRRDTVNYYPSLIWNGSIIRKVSNNELELADNCYDCFGHFLVRN